MTCASLTSASGETIRDRVTPGAEPGVMFCPGFRSDMEGTKALLLERWCLANGRRYTRFDYSGHGVSSGRFEEGTIGQWRDDALAVLDEATEGPQVIVGSSMGAWIMLLLALARPQRVCGLLGIASAPDFTRYMQRERLSEAQLQQLQRDGWCELENHYDDGTPHRIRRALLEEAEQHCLLQGDDIPIDVPVRLIHGLADADIPWQFSRELMLKLRSDDVELQLVKAGEHRLSTGPDLERMCQTLDRLVQSVAPSHESG